MANYKKHNRDQVEMKLMSINDFVPFDHKARIIVSIVDKLDLSSFDEYYNNDNEGRKAYPIKELISILIYAFLEGVFSTRKIELNCRENIIYRYLCCDDIPDHSTISRFWKRFKNEMEEILIQTVYIATEQGLIDYEHISIDGVKIKSMGSKSKLFNEKKAADRLSHIEKVVKDLTEKIEKSEDENEKKNMIKKIEKNSEIKEKIENGMEELKKIQENVKKQKSKGNKTEETNYIHTTEEDAKLMKKRSDFISGYNAQAVVDSKSNMIIASEVTSNVTDKFNGKAILEKTRKIIGKSNLKKAKITLDNGYLEDVFLKYSEKNNYDVYIPTPIPLKKSQEELDNRKPRVQGMKYDKNKNVYICPKGIEIPYKRTQIIGGRGYMVYEKDCTNKCPIADDCMPKRKRKRMQISKRIISEDNDEVISKKRNKNYTSMHEKMSKDSS